MTRSIDLSSEQRDSSQLETDVSAAHFTTTSKGRRGTCMVSKHLHVINDVSHHRIPGIGYCLERSKHNTVSIRPKDGMTVIDLANYVSSPEDSTMEQQGSSST